MTPLVQGLPAIVMFAGALLVLVPLPVLARFHRWVPILACLAAAISLAALARTSSVPVLLFEPTDTLPALSLALQWNGVALPFGIFFLVVLAGRFMFGMADDPRPFTFGGQVAAGGALVFLAADNWTTLTLAWLVVEFGLLAIPAQEGDSHGAAVQAFSWNLVAIVAWLTAGMVLSNQASSLRLEEVTIGGTAAFLILVAIWIRSGIYPFQGAAPSNITVLAVRLGLPLLLGSYLMTRFLQQAQGGMQFASEMKILALVAVGATALIVVGQAHGSEALTWTLRALGAALLLLPFTLDGRLAPASSAWFGLGAFATCTFVEIAIRWRSELPRIRLALLVWIAALLLVASLPLAPTFWARVGLLSSASSQAGIATWLLLVATMALLLVPVWREIFASSQVAPKTPARFEYAALALVLTPAIIVTVAPGMVVAPFGPEAQVGSALVYNSLFRPAGAVPLLFLLGGLLLPLLASFELARRWAPRANLVPLRVASILDLTGLAALFEFVFRFVRALIQQSLTLLEQPPIAWLIFLAIWVAIWVIGLGG